MSTLTDDCKCKSAECSINIAYQDHTMLRYYTSLLALSLLSSACDAFSFNNIIILQTPQPASVISASTSASSPRPRREKQYNSRRVTSYLMASFSSSSSSHCNVPCHYDRITAQTMITHVLCPPTEENARNIAAMEAFHNEDDDEDGDDTGDAQSDYHSNKYNNKPTHEVVITSDDPRTEYTYGEFPFNSFDILVDRAVEFIAEQHLHHQPQQLEEEDYRKNRRTITMVDIGSGCGRLVLYAALTRGHGSRCDDDDDDEVGEVIENRPSSATFESTPWDVHGVEIGKQLHSLAVKSLQRGVEHGWFEYSTSNSSVASSTFDTDAIDTPSSSVSHVQFHNGNALVEDSNSHNNHVDDAPSPSSNVINNSIQSLLSRANILFAYSTVFETNTITPYNPQLQAMLLSPKWSRTLSRVCPRGCVAITTDRALNPEDGWVLLDRIEVKNPAVWGSVGYISLLAK